jgi:hypothetical protein
VIGGSHFVGKRKSAKRAGPGTYSAPAPIGKVKILGSWNLVPMFPNRPIDSRIHREIVYRSNPISLIPHDPESPVLSEDLQVGSIHQGV